jgi:hypothetical protein
MDLFGEEEDFFYIEIFEKFISLDLLSLLYYFVYP